MGLVGTGVGPSLTPPLHMAEAAELGLGYVYRTIDLADLGIAPDRVGEVLRWARDLGFDALNVTHPCKQLVLPHLDAVDPLAAALGAVNTVLFTPTAPSATTPTPRGSRPRCAASWTTRRGDTSCSWAPGSGCGGRGRVAALRHGAAHGRRRRPRPRAGPRRFPRGPPPPRGRPAATRPPHGLVPAADGVVHCTPTGMAEHPGTAFAVDLLRPATWVADVSSTGRWRPPCSPPARAAGCRTLDGGHMAVHQAVGAFELITGRRPDTARMLAHLRALVRAV